MAAAAGGGGGAAAAGGGGAAGGVGSADGGGAAMVVTGAGGGGAAAAVCTTGAGVGSCTGVLTASVRPGGTQPGGGSKALFGSARRAGAGCGGGAAAATSTGGGGGAGGGGAATLAGAGGSGGGSAFSDCTGGAAAFAAASSLFFSSDSRRSRSRASRALASRSEVALLAASSCAFCPPLPGTREPIRGVPRVSSSGETAMSWRTRAGAAGRRFETVVARSAPGLTASAGARELPPQPARSNAARTVPAQMGNGWANRILTQERRWRTGRDSNPRWLLHHARFPSVCLKPLGHLSGERLRSL